MYYKKVLIKSEEDLPTGKRTMYFVGVKNNLHPEDIYEWFAYKNPVMMDNQAEYWINTFDWYLQPIQLDNPEIDLREELIRFAQYINKIGWSIPENEIDNYLNLR